MSAMQLVGNILSVPATTKAIVFDVDGVILDTLGADHRICTEAAVAVLDRHDWPDARAVARHFALDPFTFWSMLAAESGLSLSDDELEALVSRYNLLRSETVFDRLPGIAEIVADCGVRQIRCGVASSNDLAVVRRMLGEELMAAFPVICGLGVAGVRPKPAPDIYLEAASLLGVEPAACAFIEDSLTGLQAGRSAGYGYAVAVATGPISASELQASGLADVVYDRLGASGITLIDGAPTDKRLDTSNDFVSHMVEHIAWRLGVGIDLHWRNDDWHGLGQMLGARIAALGLHRPSAATLGMIDDGAAEVLIDRTASAGLEFDTHPSLPRQAVIDVRTEQLRSGTPLLRVLEGLADGLSARIEVLLCTFEDPHHSWEGVFRATGICLARLRAAA